MRDYYNIVRRILVDTPATRDDDMTLYGEFCARYNYDLANGNFYDIMANARALKLPNYESVTRARRKVQELEPSLRGTRRKARKEEEQVYREYYSPTNKI